MRKYRGCTPPLEEDEEAAGVESRNRTVPGVESVTDVWPWPIPVQALAIVGGTLVNPYWDPVGEFVRLLRFTYEDDECGESPELQVAGELGDTQTEPSLAQVLQERDEAIAKKQAVEAELDTCKAKLQAVEAQLLEVLEEKLRLRQEVEAWEEDMQQLVRQQVKSQLQRESRGTQGAPVNPGTGRAPWVRFLLGQWGRWR